MDFKIQYKVDNKYNFVSLGDVTLGGSIGARMDTFIYERVSGKFAIDEILKEAELELEERYDDQYGAEDNCYWRSEFWGKLMLSAVRVCKLKKDETLKEDIRSSVYRVLEYQDEDGYLCTYLDKDLIVSENKELFNWNVWGRKYILWAIIEAAMLLDDQHILNCAVNLLDHLILQIDTGKLRVKDTGVIDGMPASSILKPLLITYRLTGNSNYLDLAESIVSDMDRPNGERPNLISNALSGVAPALWYDEKDGWCAKAYEMMSCFDGFIEYYRITGEERVIEATKAFWELLVKYESNILGSVGYNEWFCNAKDYPDASTEVCDVIHWMRLCHELYKLFGNAKYMEHFEKAFLNAFLAGVYENGKDGAFFVRSSGRHWSALWQCTTKYQHCCVNNVARGFVNAAESSVAKGPDGFYINTYYKTRTIFGKKDFLINKGYFTDGLVRITARNMEEGDKVFIRIPSWSKNTTVSLGHKVISTESIVCGQYTEIILPEGNSVISIQFDMTPRIYDFEGEYRILEDNDYHVRRWIDINKGLCDRGAMVTKPMSVVYKGALLLARSKRLGCTEDEMFSGRTVWGKNARCTIENMYHPSPAVLTAELVTLETDEEKVTYRMCDYSSACNKNSEDARYFSINI